MVTYLKYVGAPTFPLLQERGDKPRNRSEDRPLHRLAWHADRQMLFGVAPAGVAVAPVLAPAAAAAARAGTFLSASFALRSISMVPLKSAPSSIMICAVVKLPTT